MLPFTITLLCLTKKFPKEISQFGINKVSVCMCVCMYLLIDRFYHKVSKNGQNVHKFNVYSYIVLLLVLVTSKSTVFTESM